MTFQNFISMSGYGPYVWSCYGLTFAVVVWMAWSGRHQLREQIQLTTRRTKAQQMEGKS